METTKFTEMRNFLKWYKSITDCPFTKKGLWEISKECESADLEVYWHYDEELNDDQVEKILENGLDGYNEVENEVYEHCYDETSRLRDDFVRSITIEAEKITDSYRKSTMKTCECEEGEVVICAEDELHEFIKDNFDLPVDLKFDDLVKRTTGEVWIDSEDDVYWYDLVSKETIEENIEKLLYFRNDDSQMADRPFKDEMDDAFGIPDITELEEPVCFSVCIADSLNDYVEMLAEHAGKYREEAPEKKWFVEINERHFALCGAPQIRRAPEYETAPGGFCIDLVDQDEVKDETLPSLTDFLFLDHVEQTQKEYIAEYIEKHLHNPNRKDSCGRSLIHYAILAENTGYLREVIDLMSFTGIYDEDDYGITPFKLIMDDDMTEISTETRDEAFNLLYKKEIVDLPLENETADSWETNSWIEIKSKMGTFMAIERNDFNYDNNIITSRDKPKLYVLNMNTGTFGWIGIDDVEFMTLVEDVKICLDGEIVA